MGKWRNLQTAVPGDAVLLYRRAVSWVDKNWDLKCEDASAPTEELQLRTKNDRLAQNRGIAEVGRDLSRTSGPNPCLSMVI